MTPLAIVRVAFPSGLVELTLSARWFPWGTDNVTLGGRIDWARGFPMVSGRCYARHADQLVNLIQAGVAAEARALPVSLLERQAQATLIHEAAHARQQAEQGWRFYPRYVLSPTFRHRMEDNARLWSKYALTVRVA